MSKQNIPNPQTKHLNDGETLNRYSLYGDKKDKTADKESEYCPNNQAVNVKEQRHEVRNNTSDSSNSTENEIENEIEKEIWNSWAIIFRFSQRLAISFHNWKRGKGSVSQYSKRKTELYNKFFGEVNKIFEIGKSQALAEKDKEIEKIIKQSRENWLKEGYNHAKEEIKQKVFDEIEVLNDFAEHNSDEELKLVLKEILIKIEEVFK